MLIGVSRLPVHSVHLNRRHIPSRLCSSCKSKSYGEGGLVLWKVCIDSGADLEGASKYSVPLMITR